MQTLTKMPNNGIWHQLKRLQEQDFIAYHEYDALFSTKLRIYGITLYGVHQATPEDEVPDDAKRFEASHFRIANFQHSLDIQRLHLWAIEAGYILLSG